MKPRLSVSLLISATLATAAFLIGWLLNREEYGAFWIVFGACCIRILLPAVVPGRFAASWYATDVVLMGAGFVLGFWIGRNNWMYVHSVVQWTIACMPLFLVVGSPLAWGLNLWAVRRRITGPYCRGCRYHLKGVANWRCPECGRPFTLKELGVSAAELQADA